MKVSLLNFEKLKSSERSKALLINRLTETLYEVELASKSLFSKLQSGAECFVFIAEIIREDGCSFFAFENLAERELFLNLKEIDSVGNKTAALAMRELGVGGLRQLLVHGPAVLGKVPGLGPKTMEKLRSGLQSDRVYFESLFSACAKAGEETNIEGGPGVEGQSKSVKISQDKVETDGQSKGLSSLVLQALVKLGVPGPEIIAMFDELEKEEKISQLAEPELIRKLLAKWSRNRSKKQVYVPERDT